MTRKRARGCEWAGKDSNLRRLSQQIYSLPPLAAWVPTRKTANLGQPNHAMLAKTK